MNVFAWHQFQKECGGALRSLTQPEEFPSSRAGNSSQDNITGADYDLGLAWYFISHSAILVSPTPENKGNRFSLFGVPLSTPK